MAPLQCPKCDVKFTVGDGWAKSAISTLMPAPAVPDMATQVRCPKCQYLFAEGEIRHLASSRSKGTVAIVLLVSIAALIGLLLR